MREMTSMSDVHIYHEDGTRRNIIAIFDSTALLTLVVSGKWSERWELIQNISKDLDPYFATTVMYAGRSSQHGIV